MNTYIYIYIYIYICIYVYIYPHTFPHQTPGARAMRRMFCLICHVSCFVIGGSCSGSRASGVGCRAHTHKKTPNPPRNPLQL